MKNFKLLLLICFVLFCTISCDKIKPDIHPEKKGEEKGWYFGFRFFTEW